MCDICQDQPEFKAQWEGMGIREQVGDEERIELDLILRPVCFEV